MSNWCSYDESVIDTRTGREVRRIPIGPNPRGIAVAPDSSVAYVAEMGGSDIAVIHLADLTTTWFHGVGSGPRQLVLSPDGRWLYATLNGAGRVVKIDTRSGGIAASVATGTEPRSMAISTDGAVALRRELRVEHGEQAARLGPVRPADHLHRAAPDRHHLRRPHRRCVGRVLRRGDRGVPRPLTAPSRHGDGQRRWISARQRPVTCHGASTAAAPGSQRRISSTWVAAPSGPSGTASTSPRRAWSTTTRQPSGTGWAGVAELADREPTGRVLQADRRVLGPVAAHLARHPRALDDDVAPAGEQAHRRVGRGRGELGDLLLLGVVERSRAQVDPTVPRPGDRPGLGQHRTELVHGEVDELDRSGHRRRRLQLVEPGRRAIEQVAAHVVAAVEHVAQLLLAEEDAVEADLDPRHRGQASLCRVGDRRERVDGGDLERQLGAADAGQLGGQHQQVGTLRAAAGAPR